MRWHLLAPIALALAWLLGTPATAMTPGEMSHGRYTGTPDLALTSAMIAAGGGPRHFHALRLSGMLAAQHAPAEIRSLNARFGRERVQRYVATFDRFVADALRVVTAAHVRVPPPSPALARDPYVLAASLRNAGVMPDGRWDVGYFLEHLLSRPVHVAIMRDANANPAIGPAANADFHVILTAEMNDLRSLYHLAR